MRVASAPNKSTSAARVLAAFFESIGVAAATATHDIDGIEHYLSDETVAALKRVTTKLKRT
jgi:Mn-dependent DtxR family transcriptional regulator